MFAQSAAHVSEAHLVLHHLGFPLYEGTRFLLSPNSGGKQHCKWYLTVWLPFLLGSITDQLFLLQNKWLWRHHLVKNLNLQCISLKTGCTALYSSGFQVTKLTVELKHCLILSSVYFWLMCLGWCWCLTGIMFTVVNSESSLSDMNMDWNLLIILHCVPFFSTQEFIKILSEKQCNRGVLLHLMIYIKYCK